MKFNENQLRAINKTKGNASVIATAGSGKTSVIVNRIVNLVENYDVNPTNILAVTFSKKAKENMATRLKPLINSFSDVNVETFHSLALQIINAKYPRMYTTWDDRKKWEKEKEISRIYKNVTGSIIKDKEFNEIFKFFTVQKNNMLKPSDNLIFEPDNQYPLDDKGMQSLFIEYEKHKEINKLIEFDDYLNMACDILKEDNKIFTIYNNKFKYILSDEYQDVSMNQEKLIEILGKGNNVFVVGDPLQAIYAFRNGDSRHLLDFDEVWDNTEIINLDINYRCSKDIIKVANKFAESIPDSKHKTYVESKANKPINTKPIFTNYNTAYDECKGVAKRIKELNKSGVEYKDIAILSRTNAQLQKFETVFHTQKIPFDIVDGSSLTDLKEIKLVIQYLKLLDNPHDNEAFRYIYNKPNRWLDKKFLEEVESITNSKGSLYINMDKIRRRNWRFQNGIDEIYKTIAAIKPSRHIKNVGDMIHILRQKLDIDGFVSKGNIGDDGISEQIDNLDSFEDLCKQFKTITEFNKYIEDLSNSKSDKLEDNIVKLLTIHKAKGLEFKNVFIVGCSDGLLPHMRTIDVDDERRLMYVAITRAEENLFLSSVEIYNNNVFDISPFIDELGDTIIRTDK